MKITDIAKQISRPYLKEEAVCVDFTLGNGNDTQYFLSYPIKRVYAFEIQEDVYQKSKKHILDERAQLLCVGHEHVLQYVKEPIDLGIFNFGYCPNGNEEITTLLSTSKKAVEDALTLLKVHGKLILVLYVGHKQGQEEANYFSEWVKQLDTKRYEVMKITLENRLACPFIITVEKVRGN